MWGAPYVADTEAGTAAGVGLGDAGAQQLGGAERSQAGRVGVPLAATAERAKLKARAFVAHHQAHPAAPGIVHGRPDARDAAVGHLVVPFLITSARAWATGAEQMPRLTRA